MSKRFSNQRTRAEHRALVQLMKVCNKDLCFERPSRFSSFCSSHRGPVALRPQAHQ
jgi:hypothetical protein